MNLFKICSRHLACEEDHLEEAKLLISNGADKTLLNKEKKSPLQLASNKMLNALQNEKLIIEVVL